MGFFSDLKEDLSQAVNELMPEELVEKPVAEEPAEEMAAESAQPEEVLADVAAEDFSVELSLEEMLKNIDDIQIPEEEYVTAGSDESMDASLEDALAAALESIPDENGILNMAAEESWMYKEPIEEVIDSAVDMPVVESAVMASVPVAETVYDESITETPQVEEPEYEENKIEDKGADKTMDSYVNRQVADETAVITAGMQIKGDITSEGSVDVVGMVEGNIDIWGKLNVTGRINGNSKASEIYAEGAKITGEIVSGGAVKIGDSSVIIGNITAKSAAIAGAVKGDIDVQGPVILDASAIVMGNIKSKSVQINNGAVIEGMCSQCYADVSPLSFFDEYKTEIKNSKKNK